jgi:hypothetical protein
MARGQRMPPSRLAAVSLALGWIVLVLVVVAIIMREAKAAGTRRRISASYDVLPRTVVSAPQRLGVLQIEDRRARILDAFIAHNAQQALGQGFEHIVSREGIDGFPPYWWKIAGLKRLMTERPDLDLVMWLDSDAYVTPSALRRIRRLAEDRDRVMWVSPDPPRWGAPFCAGAFVIRNSPRGRWIVDTWLSCYDPARWRKEGGGWHARGAWAGTDYEQGAFTDRLLPHWRRLGISVQPWRVFGDVECQPSSEESIVVHLSGEYKEERGESCVALLAAHGASYKG